MTLDPQHPRPCACMLVLSEDCRDLPKGLYCRVGRTPENERPVGKDDA